MIYLDNSASTYIKPKEVIKAVNEIIQQTLEEVVIMQASKLHSK